METIVASVETDREEYEGRRASLALQRALAGAGAWMGTSVRDQRKCDHPLLPAEIPANIRAKVAKMLQERGVGEKEPAEPTDPKAPWYHQLEQHVARLMQQMRNRPQQFRQLLLMAAGDPSADCAGNQNSSRGFVDSRSAYRRLRRAALSLGEEIFYIVRAFVRRSETNGVFPQEAQVTRLASLYKLELRRHVTISTVIECIHQADSDDSLSSIQTQFANRSIIRKRLNKHSLLRRQVKSAGIAGSGAGLDTALCLRAISAPADVVSRGIQNHQSLESGSTPEKIKTVHAFKLQALERLLATTWQAGAFDTQCSLQTMTASLAEVSDETKSQIQERVTAFLYHRSRENYPLWSEPPFSKEETARHLRTFVATCMISPLLQNLTVDQLLEMARAAKWQNVAPGDALCTQNTEINALFVVMDGSLTSTDFESDQSSPSCVAPVCLGELGMVRSAERWPQTLTAESVNGVKVLTLSKLTFEALLHRFFYGGKALPPAFTSAANVVHPRRPSSSPAVVAKRVARSFRSSLPGWRPSTAVPTTATVSNIARWHEVRDEKLRDYRIGLEAEQRATALEELQKAMAELSSASSDEDENELLKYLTSGKSPHKHSSHYESYPSFTPTSNTVNGLERPESDEEIVDSSESLLKGQLTNFLAEIPTDSTSTEFADQLREFYRTLNARRSLLKVRLASSANSDQMVQQVSERKRSATEVLNNTDNTSTTTTSETTWWVDEVAENWTLPTEDNVEIVLEDTIISASGTDLPIYGRLQGVTSHSPAFSPSKKHRKLPSLKSPQKPVVSPSRDLQKDNITGVVTDVIQIIHKEEVQDPEITESDEESSPIVNLKPVSKSSNQSEDDKVAISTQARKSALNILLTRQSTATMARHSKLIDAQTAQHVLVQKHFADTSGTSSRPQSGRSSSSRPQSGRPQSAGSVAQVLHQTHSHAPLPLRADLQQRMDSVLNELQLPPKSKLNLVLKYTHADFYDHFPMAVQLWERVNDAVSRRERVMNSLWEFEMLASDPRRHFRTISTQRLREEKDRDELFVKLNQASKTCIDVIDELFRCCGDIVYLGGRQYRQKMTRDYIELLYEVEQERLGIIYNGVRSHVAPVKDESAVDNQPAQEKEDELLPSRPSSGRTLIKVRMPSISSLTPRPPYNKKDGNSIQLSGNSATNLPSSLRPGNQQESAIAVQTPEFAVNGTNVDPTSARHRLVTPRESIFVPLASLNSKLESFTAESEQQIKRTSRVTIQVQKQRQAELAALKKQLDSAAKTSSPSAISTRQPEKTYSVSEKDAKKTASRRKLQEERVSLRELFQQFMTRSKC